MRELHHIATDLVRNADISSYRYREGSSKFFHGRVEIHEFSTLEGYRIRIHFDFQSDGTVVNVTVFINDLFYKMKLLLSKEMEKLQSSLTHLDEMSSEWAGKLIDDAGNNIMPIENTRPVLLQDYLEHIHGVS